MAEFPGSPKGGVVVGQGSSPVVSKVQLDGEETEDLVAGVELLDAGLDSRLTKAALMHGRVEVLVDKARRLNSPGFFPLGAGLKLMVKMKVGSTVLLRSSVTKNTRDPDWKELFVADVCHEGQKLVFEVVHVKGDPSGDPQDVEEVFLGQVAFSVAQILEQSQGSSGVQGEFPLSVKKTGLENLDTYGGAWTEDRAEKARRRKTGKKGWLSFRLRFTPATTLIEKARSVYNVFLRNEKMNKKSRVERYHPLVVPNTYFSARSGEYFVLYQSAHQPGLSQQLPDISLGFPTDASEAESMSEAQRAHSLFRARSCWSDLFNAINEAERFICVSGWTLHPGIKLVRNTNEVQPTFGQLLKDKARQGVLVFVLLWDPADAPGENKTAHENGGAFGPDPVKFFANTNVVVVRVKRKHQYKKRQSDKQRFSHQQRFIVMDIKPSNAAKLVVKHRRHKNIKVQGVTAFVGGLDIATGRFDDSDKLLFASRLRKHREDFFSPCFPAAVLDKSEGPRQPWQDVCARVTGRAAVDVLKNFIERWHREAGFHRYVFGPLFRLEPERLNRGFAIQKLLRLLKNSPAEGALPQSFLAEARDQVKGNVSMVLKLGDGGNTRNNFGINAQNDKDDEMDSIDGMDDEDIADLQEDLRDLQAEERARSSSWNAAYNTETSDHQEKVIQVLRSLDDDIARMDKRVTEPKVHFDSDLKVDNSLHKAFVHHIRSAEHFMYLEQESFIGSSHLWSKGVDRLGSTNLVPGEIAAKLCDKIRKREQFHCYLVLPLFPLGLANSPHARLQLHFQRLTIEMVYTRVAMALQEVGDSEASPTDYFSVYTLGARELAEDGLGPPPQEDKVSGQDDDPAEDPVAKRLREKLSEQVSPADKENYVEAYKSVIRSRRGMIYVHSRLLIVDDQVALIGGGGVSERSLSGSANSELAVSVFEAGEMATPELGTPRGQVYGYRMSLWTEHLGANIVGSDAFNAISLQAAGEKACVQTVSQHAAQNWKAFVGSDLVNLRGHIMSYPYNVDKATGQVTAVQEHLPDFKEALIGGSDTNPLHLPKYISF